MALTRSRALIGLAVGSLSCAPSVESGELAPTTLFAAAEKPDVREVLEIDDLYLERAISESVCEPPRQKDVDDLKRRLVDFAVVYERRGRLAARLATDQELSDLAYFLVAVDRAGPEVGAGLAQTERELSNEERSRLRDDFGAVLRTGDARAVVSRGHELFEAFGLGAVATTPQTMRRSARTVPSGQLSEIMRGVARAHEQRSEFEEAEVLYRGANEGGFICGTGNSARWKSQVKGAIRAAELDGRCLSVVAEHLLDIEPHRPVYGPKRLTDAGFDLARLYRGALVTLNRGADRPLPRRLGGPKPDDELDRLRLTFEALPPEPRQRAVHRLSMAGRQDWERRVHALEGFADVAQAKALPALVRAADEGVTDIQIRALDAIGALARKPDRDPCGAFGGLGTGSGSFGHKWRRKIRSMSRTCEGMLTKGETRLVVRKLSKHLRNARPRVRVAAARALGEVGAPSSLGALRRLLADPYNANQQSCDRRPQMCSPVFPVRRAAQSAIDRIKKLAKVY